jgi:pyruvate dehydrogenase E2 component (dihydrolipoamide acetyltransferase)
MATNILMPALSPTMTEGTLARWLKKEGEQVKAGDIIAEIETDKATMEVEAVDEGILGRIIVPDGTAGVKVNDPIAVLVEEGESAGAAPAAPPAAAPSPSPAAPEATPAAAAVAPQPAPAPQPLKNGHDAGRIFVSPLARRMASQAGIDLGALTGSGPNGRIVRADIEAFQKGGGAAAAPLPVSAPAPAPAPARAPAPAAPAAMRPAPKPAAISAPHRLVPHSTMRKVIGRRLTESHQQVPNFFVTMDCEIDALLKLRADLNAKSPKDGPAAYKLSVNDLVIKAAAAALRRVPQVNAGFTEDAMVLYDDVDISVAVSIPDGLITPIIRKADQKGLASISREMKDLGARAKSGKLKPEEFQGGTFSISNLGMFGTKQFTAIINPPQAAILAVGAGEKRPVVKDDALAIATVMTCTLSVDHRVADGALGAEWMSVFKALIEDPLSLML